MINRGYLRQALPLALTVLLSSFAVSKSENSASPDDEGLLAGAAVTNIDPPKLPVIQNGGFSQKIASSVSQSLFVRSLVLAKGSEKVAICVVDTCMMDRELCDRAKGIVSKETGIPGDRILLSATHTHTAPSVMRCLGCPPDPDYPDFLVPKIVESIVEANAALKPAEAGAIVADAGDFTNTRRWIYLPHKVRFDPYGNPTVRAMMHPGHENPDTAGPSGPEDPDLTLLSIRSREGKPLAVLGNLSQHYYARGSLSSGYSGTFCRLLEDEFGDDFVGLMSQGTSGDLQYIDYSRPKSAWPFASAKDPYEAYCRALADLAINALKKVEYRSDLELAMAESKLTLGRRLPDKERIAWATPIAEGLGEKLPEGRVEVLAKEVFWVQENPSEELILQAIRVGDFGITALPNEVYGLTGLKLKGQSPLPTLMNIELANGSAGYIPPPEQHHLGGYTTWPARTAGLEVSAEPKIVEATLGLLERVSGAPRRTVKEDQSGKHARKLSALKPDVWWQMGIQSGNLVPDASGHEAPGELEPGYALYLEGPTGKSEDFNSVNRGNRAIHFAGGRMRSDCPALNRGSDYSVSLWFWNAMPHDARAMTGYLFGLGQDENSQACDQIGISGTALGKPGRLVFYNGDMKREIHSGETLLKEHHWHHLFVVREDETVRVYLDGSATPEIEATITDSRPEKNTSLFVGGRSDGRFNFEGKIDEVAVFSRALSTLDNPVQTRSKPNVLFIGIDDLRPELFCYGASHIKSPNIDRLASQGVLFERAYCQWAVCMPSRASLLSGLRPDTFEGKSNLFRKIVPEVVTLPQHFKDHGYFTQSFGKIYHGAWKTAYVGNSFQDPESWSVERWAASPQYYFSPEGMKAAREHFLTSNDKFLQNVKRDPGNPDQWKHHFVRGFATEAPEVADHIPADGATAQAALETLRELHSSSPGQPFFLAVGFSKPHLPFVAPKKYWDLYDPDLLPPPPLPRPPKGAPSFAVSPGPNELNQYLEKAQGLVPPRRARHLRHGYAACVSYVDALVGQLLDELEALNLRENTIVVLWSDHGYKLGDFGAWAKHTNFEIDTRVPLIISAPHLPEGEKSMALVELVDLHPTLSQLAGLPIQPGAEGESFYANLTNPGAGGQGAAFSQFPKGDYMGYSIRTATHRYTEWRDESGNAPFSELYDYGESNIEMINLADDPAYHETAQDLRSQLREAFP